MVEDNIVTLNKLRKTGEFTIHSDYKKKESAASYLDDSVVEEEAPLTSHGG